jgi:hypothetical protein
MSFNPHIVLYTDWFIPSKNYAAYSWGPIICIRKKHELDEPLLAHEQTHSKQFWRTFGTHGIWYMLKKSYRYKSELEAYAVQIAKSIELKYIYTDPLSLQKTYKHYGSVISKYYNLDVDVSEASRVLKIKVEQILK